MRSWRSEMVSLAETLAVPALALVAFPYGAFSFRADQPKAEDAPTVSFVTIAAAEERQAVRAARTSLRGESGDVRWMRADLSVKLQEEEFTKPILPVSSPERSARLQILSCGRVPYFPSQRARSAERIEKGAGWQPELPFSREDLLKID